MDGDDLNLSLDFQMQREIDFLKGLEEIGRVESSTAFSELMKLQTADQWAQTESERPLVGYNKKSKRKAYLDAQKAREKEVADQKSRERSVSVTQINDDVTHMHSSLSAAQFRSFFKPITHPDLSPSPPIVTDKDSECESDLVAPAKDSEIFFGGYESDIPDDEPLDIAKEPTDEPTEDDEGLLRKRQCQVLDISVPKVVSSSQRFGACFEIH